MGSYPNWMEKESSALPCGFDLLVDAIYNDPIGKLLKL